LSLFGLLLSAIAFLYGVYVAFPLNKDK
jgi:hypothetical protein